MNILLVCIILLNNNNIHNLLLFLPLLPGSADSDDGVKPP